MILTKIQNRSTKVPVMSGLLTPVSKFALFILYISNSGIQFSFYKNALNGSKFNVYHSCLVVIVVKLKQKGEVVSFYYKLPLFSARRCVRPSNKGFNFFQTV